MLEFLSLIEGLAIRVVSYVVAYHFINKFW